MKLTQYARLAVVTLAISVLASCATLQEALKEPEISVQDMRVKSVSLSDMQLDFIVGVKNPNPLGISLKGMSYKLDVEDESLLSGESRQRLKIGANSSSSLTLPLSLNYEEVFGGIEALLKRDQVGYTLSGKLDFGLFRLPYKKQGSIDLPSLPQVSVGRVAIERIGLSGLDIVLALNVSNENSFPIKLDGIDYGLKLADTTVASGNSLGALSLEPGKSGQLNIGLKLGYRELGGVINALRNSSTIPVAFDGRLRLPGAGSVPLNWQGDVAIAH